MSSKDLKYFSWQLSWGADGGAARASHADMSYVALRYAVGSEMIHRQEGDYQMTEI